MDEKLIFNLLSDSQNDIKIQDIIKRNRQLNEKLKKQRDHWMRDFSDNLTDLESKYVDEAFELGFDLSLILQNKEPYFNL